ncbi:MAG: WbuC family cupin fold metalloprotein [Proteobacteria bacterium]|nr:WbuC family cupin fold metalloprotein [Pseudomonadota bacterium]MBU1738361.1 WbuC family cupin fold metalloprotein [Pseudomonadota bacterium]
MREAPGALFNDQSCLVVDQTMVEEIKQRALSDPRGRFRLCLHHRPSDGVQQMIIACTPRSYSAPHRHPGRVLSYQMIEGRLSVVLFDDNGRVEQVFRLGGDGPFCLWLGASQWYMPLAETETAVFCEVLQGPNADDQAVEWAPWAPEEGGPEAAAYLRKLGCDVLGIGVEYEKQGLDCPDVTGKVVA